MTPYPTYKPSGLPWLGDIPAHWDVRRLKFVAHISSEKLDVKPSELTYVGLENIEARTGKLLMDAPAEHVESAVNVFHKGDVLFAKLRPYLAKVMLAPFGGVCTTELLVLQPGSTTNNVYLAHLMLSHGFISEVNAQTYGAKMPRANAEQVGNMTLALPPPEEQSAIVAFLDHKGAEIDRFLSAKRRLIALLREQKAALITQVVTHGLNPHAPTKPSGVTWLGDVPAHWDVRRLRFLTTKIGSGVTPLGGATVYLDEGIPFLRSQNVHFDGLRLDDVAFISASTHQAMKNSQVYPNDVLLNITGASIGRCCIYNATIGEANVNQHVCIIRPRPNAIGSQYLAYYLATPGIQWQIRTGQNGSSREGLTFSEIKEFFILLPPPNEQAAIVAHIDREAAKIDKAIARTEREMELIHEYRATLISEAVTGKWDVSEASQSAPHAAPVLTT